MPIQTLSSQVALRIAAGEVIEKPASIVREAIDNAIDAGAKNIRVVCEGGGSSRLSIFDDGCGFDEEDLERVGVEHSTSKIKTIDDLYSLATMGFRGEAIASIQAVAKLTIESNGHCVAIYQGKRSEVEKCAFGKGTCLKVENLFADMPARRAFLGSALSQERAIRTTVTEKALAFEEASFKLYFDSKLALEYPAATKRERVAAYLCTPPSQNLLKCISATEADYSVDLYYVDGISRPDRGRIKVFVNNRPVDEPTLVNAVDRAFARVLPGGHHPLSVLFVAIDPALVDFNIHPAKRECRIRPIKALHHTITQMGEKAVTPYVHSAFDAALGSPYDAAPLGSPYNAPQLGESAGRHTGGPVFPAGLQYSSPRYPSMAQYSSQAKGAECDEASGTYRASAEQRAYQEDLPGIGKGTDFVYIGQAFDTFLIAQRAGEIVIVDQHAAAERIMYDSLKGGGATQMLLMPIPIETESEVAEYIGGNLAMYRDLGIILEPTRDGGWQVTALPAGAANDDTIINLISTTIGPKEEVERILWSRIACHASIKKGDPVSPDFARALLEKVFALESPTCPHGRVFLTTIKQEDLETLVGRD